MKNRYHPIHYVLVVSILGVLAHYIIAFAIVDEWRTLQSSTLPGGATSTSFQSLQNGWRNNGIETFDITTPEACYTINVSDTRNFFIPTRTLQEWTRFKIAGLNTITPYTCWSTCDINSGPVMSEVVCPPKEMCTFGIKCIQYANECQMIAAWWTVGPNCQLAI